MIQKYSSALSNRVRTSLTGVGIGHCTISSNTPERTWSNAMTFHPIAGLVGTLQRSPGMRGIAYLSGAVVILEAVRSTIDITRPDATVGCISWSFLPVRPSPISCFAWRDGRI